MSFKFAVVIVILSCWMLTIQGKRGTWSGWTDVTECNAKPCKCEIDRCPEAKAKCKTGMKVQMRVCIMHEDDDEACRGLSMRKLKCRNVRNCPGWSSWTQTSKCVCPGNESGVRNGTSKAMRYCDNPAPIHDEVLCYRTNCMQKREEERNDYFCQCEEDSQTLNEATTEAFATTTSGQKCSCPVMPDYTDEPNGNTVVPEGTTFSTTTAEPNEDYDDFLDGIKGDETTCPPCTSEPAEVTVEP